VLDSTAGAQSESPLIKQQNQQIMRTKLRKKLLVNTFHLNTNFKNYIHIYIELRTAFAARTYLAEEQWLGKQMNMVKLRVLCMVSLRGGW
jgi:hypothetical protein